MPDPGINFTANRMPYLSWLRDAIDYAWRNVFLAVVQTFYAEQHVGFSTWLHKHNVLRNCQIRAKSEGSGPQEAHVVIKYLQGNSGLVAWDKRNKSCSNNKINNNIIIPTEDEGIYHNFQTYLYVFLFQLCVVRMYCNNTKKYSIGMNAGYVQKKYVFE